MNIRIYTNCCVVKKLTTHSEERGGDQLKMSEVTKDESRKTNSIYNEYISPV